MGTEFLMPSLLTWEAGGGGEGGTPNLVFFLLGLDKRRKKSLEGQAELKGESVYRASSDTELFKWQVNSGMLS